MSRFIEMHYLDSDLNVFSSSTFDGDELFITIYLIQILPLINDKFQ